MASSEERAAVARALREAVIDDGHLDRPYGEQGFQVTLRRLIGTSNPTRRALYSRLADLVDPTCEVVGTATSWPLHGPQIFIHELSCGHTCYTDWPEPPKYCDQCGARVVDGHDAR